MYEVRWTFIKLLGGMDWDEPYDDSREAWAHYDALVEHDGIVSVGIYLIDRNGKEWELASWSR